ncbi:MAG: hypothetical protein A2X32_09545 [Elusimicrobia bacterium GWC2_64_44]|nr:MAG: hypothetical protein A2X32_09545 [Elusimicrobia bacterium GWC2_64_44]
MKNILLLLPGFVLACGCATPPLYKPARDGDLRAVRALLDAGAKPDAVASGYAHLTALHMAAANNRYEVAKLLIERGADLNPVSYNTVPKATYGTPLHFAACAGANSIVQLLLERGADPEPGPGRCHNYTGSSEEVSPLELAESHGHVLAAQLIRDRVAGKLGLASGSARNAGEYGPLVSALLKDYSGDGKTIAVAGFAYTDGRASSDGKVVSERVTTELIKTKKLKVVEREQIEKMLAELRLQSGGAIDQDSARRLGKLLGADLLVIGTMAALPGGKLELNLRLASVESGEALSAVNGRVEKDWL